MTTEEEDKKKKRLRARGVGGTPAIAPLIDYKGFTLRTQAGYTRSFNNFGTFAEDAEVFTGRALKPNNIDIVLPLVVNANVQTVYYMRDGVATFDEQSQFIGTLNLTDEAEYSNAIFYDGIFTENQKRILSLEPESFAFNLNQTLLKEWFPMCDSDSYIRSGVKYSEGANIPIASSAGWVDNGDGTYTADGTQTGTISIATTNGDVVEGKIYRLDIETINVTAGVFNVYIGGNFRSFTTSISEKIHYVGLGDTGGGSGRLFLQGNLDFIGTVKVNSFTEITSGIHPITMPTEAMHITGLNTGIQTAKLDLDAFGRVIGEKADFNLYGTETAVIPSQTNTVDITMIVNPTVLAGNVLSGAVTLDTTGMTAGIDNNVSLLAQVVNGSITIGSGFKGTIKQYTEDLS